MNLKRMGFLATALILTTISCTKNTRVAVEDTKQNNPDTQKIADDHNAQNSLDYDGIYLGVLPCADCEGIKTTLYINRDKSYMLKQQYLKESSKATEEKGSYSWDITGSIITLKPNTKDGNPLKFFIGENTIYTLDQSGNRITGPLSDNYMLTKSNYALLNKKWRILEMYDKHLALENTSNKESFITFDEKENRIIAIAGCNTISANFKILPNAKLEFGEFISTAMACENMENEGNLSKVLKEIKQFSIDNDELTLLDKNQKIIATLKIPMH